MIARKSLIEYSDIHCHILPFLDDGARSWEEAVEMARISKASGAKRVFATPHYIGETCMPPATEICRMVTEFRRRLQAAEVDLEVLPGSEIHISPSLARDFAAGRIQSLGMGRFVLVELPFLGLPEGAADILFELRLEGAGVIIAHPERNADLRRDLRLCLELAESGIYLQLNLGSLLGVYGRDVRLFAEKLVRYDLVHFVGTDGHRGTPGSARGCDARQGLSRLAKLSGEKIRILQTIEERVDSLIMAGSA